MRATLFAAMGSSYRIRYIRRSAPCAQPFFAAMGSLLCQLIIQLVPEIRPCVFDILFDLLRQLIDGAKFLFQTQPL